MSRHQTTLGQQGAELLLKNFGRRGFLKTVVGASVLGAGMTVAECSHVGAQSIDSKSDQGLGYKGKILQPGVGDVIGDAYVQSTPDSVLWGYLPTVNAAPVARIKSGQTVTMDLVSHEGILEDQGKDPLAFFGGKGVPEDQVLQDAIDIARDYSRTQRDFIKDGPHVVTGPVFVEGAEPGDVLKIEPLDNELRVPYGVVSSRHGKGTLASGDGETPPAGISLGEVLPPVETRNNRTDDFQQMGNVSVFVPVEGGRGLIESGPVKARFPLRPFPGMMGVATERVAQLNADAVNSVPPTLGGGNIDIHHLGSGSAFYLPVVAEGALFYSGDPHMAMGDGEVALTAMEGSLRSTFRLTVCKQGDGTAPAVAYKYPWAETEEFWIPIGLSDPNGLEDGSVDSDLNVAMRRAVINALDFLEQEQGMERMIAYAYLSAAADFALSQFVDRTVGIHGLIRKADFE